MSKLEPIPDYKPPNRLEPNPDYLRPCRDPEHDPPTHMHIPQGMRLRHSCPTCGKESLSYPVEVYL